MAIIIDGVTLAPASFYITQMQRTVSIFEQGRIADVGQPVLSFFSGIDVQEPSANIFAGHIEVFFTDRIMQARVTHDTPLFLEWLSAMFRYFLEMAAFPELPESIWTRCWCILDGLDSLGKTTFFTRIQLAGWAGVYNQQYAKIALAYLKGVSPKTREQEACRSLILATNLNKGQPDFLDHVIKSFSMSGEFSAINRLQAIVHYYCHVDSTPEILCMIISVLNWNELTHYRAGKMGLMEPVLWKMQCKNNYADLLFFLRCLRFDINGQDLETSHAFLLPSMSETFTALKKSERITFPVVDNGVGGYKKLMRLCNKLGGIAISMRGASELGADVQKYEDYGTPNRIGDFDELRQEVIGHYHLDDKFYAELNLMSLVPSHNHPVQAALCSLGVIPPILSTSLTDLKDEGSERKFVFFLASSTYTHDIECRWILDNFGEGAEIYTDPSALCLLQKLNDGQYTHVYISAHGIYDHWEKTPEAIHFKEDCITTVEQLAATRKEWHHRRTVVLNICDGGNARISFNIYNSGLAAALASGDQVVVSHLWPVNPKYAALFGLLMLEQLRSHGAAAATYNVYCMLDRPNNEIAETLAQLGNAFGELASMTKNTDFTIADFRNLGSMAIYA